MHRLIPISYLITVVSGLSGCGNSPGSVSLDDGLRNGDVTSSAPIQLFVVPAVPFLGSSHKITYRSSDRHGDPVLLTGTVTTPLTPWVGPGQRPIVAFAVGTHGVADRCASSNQMAQGTDYEAAVVSSLLALGYAVVITDYLGVGTDEPSTYINRLDQGHAVLDSIRAAQRLAEAGLPDAGPVAIFGYSQGGEGSAAALELQSSYAPELKVIAGYAGAIPSRIDAVIAQVDGGPYAGLMGNFFNGLNAGFPDNRLLDELNDNGIAFVNATAGQCVPEVAVLNALVQSNTLFNDGRSFAAHLGDAKWRGPMAAQRIGAAKPLAPVLVLQSIADDVVPAVSSLEAARGWCGLGASVQYNVVVTPSHVPAGAAGAAEAVSWLSARIQGQPAATNCGEF